MYLSYVEKVEECFDAFTGEFFTLHVHLLSWSGDLPALSKIMCTTGHNSYLGCCFCYIRGMTANRHVYYPLESLNSVTRTRYDPKELLLRTHQSYIQDVNAVMVARSIARDQERRDRGIGY